MFLPTHDDPSKETISAELVARIQDAIKHETNKKRRRKVRSDHTRPLTGC